MAILKANGKILKANGKILKAGGGDIFFLTYFENFNESTGTDTPIIGEPYTLDIQKQYLTKSSLNLFGGACSAIKDEYRSQKAVGFTKPIPENIDFISSELFILCEGTRYDFGSSVGLDSTYITLDPFFSSVDFGIFGPGYDGSSSQYTLYNGTTRAYGTYFKFGKNIRFKTSHIAVTYDIKNKIKRFYVDGDIMLELRNQNSTDYNFSMCQANTGKSFIITGVAFFSSDKSINNGMNYPVPTQRYA